MNNDQRNDGQHDTDQRNDESPARDNICPAQYGNQAKSVQAVNAHAVSSKEQ
jgi:hypothetical protein